MQASGNQPPLDPRTEVHAMHPWMRRLVVIAAWAIGIALFLHFFAAVKLVLLGFLAAAALASAVKPLMRYVPGPRPLRAIAVGIAPVLVTAGVIVLVTWLLAGHVRESTEDLPELESNVDGVLARISDRLGLDNAITMQTIGEQFMAFLTGSASAEIVTTGAGMVTSFGIGLAFIFFGCIYLLVEPPGRLTGPMLQMLPPPRRVQFAEMLRRTEPRLRWWVVGSLISMLIVGVASWIGYRVVGLQFAGPLALLAGISEIVPTVGPIIAFVVAVFFAAGQDSGTVWGVLIVYVIVQTLESQVLLPIVMRQAVKISPVVTLFTVVLWGKIFGVGGVLLAIPINLVIWSALENFMLRPKGNDIEIVSSAEAANAGAEPTVPDSHDR
jgi:predicted PurR-regulated permease PerM